MKKILSKLNSYEVAEHLRLDDYDESTLQRCMDTAIDYMKSYTGRDIDYMDEHAEFIHAFMVLCQEFYDNRNYSQPGQIKTNLVVDCILGMHRCNLV